MNTHEIGDPKQNQLKLIFPPPEYFPASSSNEVRSYVSRLHVNTQQRIAVAESKQLKHKRQADFRKESRRSLKALVARLDAVSLYALLYGMVSLH
jgi:hypothetical protein